MIPLLRVPQFISFVTIGWLSTALSVSAQIVPDGTLPNNTVVEVDGDFFQITGGTPSGNNLFHSFEDFSVPTNSTAFFDNAVEINNIISRVTGGRFSNIDGLIQANGTANLFLINPSGIVFGPNAQLDIGGSFFGSTASSLNFADGTEFSATNPQQPILTINVPIGLQYGTNAADVEVRGAQLEVQPGAILALAGGNVTLENASFFAPGGRIELGGLVGEGTIAFNEDGGLNIPDTIVRGNVSLANNSTVDVAAEGDGNITIQAGNIVLLEQSNLFAGIAEDLGSPDAVAGDIILDATGMVTLDGGSNIANNIQENATGVGGDIAIVANSLSLTNNSSLDMGTFGFGNAGNLLVTVNENVTLQNSRVFSDASVGRGNSGEISIAAKGVVTIAENSEIISDVFNPNEPTEGIAGSINLVGNAGVAIANSTLTSESNNIDTNADIGNISLVALEGSVSLNQATLSTSNFGGGSSGSLTFDARDEVAISNSSLTSDGELGVILVGSVLSPNSITIENSQLTAINDVEGGQGGVLSLLANQSATLTDSLLSSDAVNEEGVGGNAGLIEITAPQGISIGNSQITSDSNSNNKDPNTNTSNIILTALGGSINLERGTLSTTNFGSGSAGLITLNGGDRITILNQSNLFSDAYNEQNPGTGGIAGAIEIVAPNGIEIANSTLTSESDNSDVNAEFVGSIDLNTAQGAITLDRGTLSTTNFGSGLAGFITLNSGNRVTISNNSSLFSDAYNEQNPGLGGSAGAIEIVAPHGIKIENSTITSESDSNNIDPDSQLGNISLIASEGSVELNLNSDRPSEPRTISTTNVGSGFAGDILINARNEVSIFNSLLTSDGELGQLLIGNQLTPNVVTIQDSELTTQNEVEDGQAGVLRSIANQTTTITNSILLSDAFNEQGVGGNAGLIEIVSPQGIAIANSLITSDSNSNNTDLNANVGDIRLTSSESSIALNQSTTLSATNFGSGLAGFITLNAGNRVTISNNSNLFSDAYNEQNPGTGGIAGSIEIVAPNGIDIANSTLTSESDNSDLNAEFVGSIDLNAAQGSININRAKLSTLNFSSGFGGFIRLQAGDLITITNSSLLSDAFNEINEMDLDASGIAGVINISAPNEIEISNSTITSESENDLNSDIVGDIAITASQGEVKFDRVILSVTNFGSGLAGDVKINSQSLELENSLIEANSSAGDGGNVEVNTRGLVRMRDRSVIATNAGTEEAPGNGGDIRVNSEFLIGVENSDITANAFEGSGGVIQINSEGIIGLQFREKLTPFNDITAFSEQNPDLSGVVEINSTAVDTSGLVTLAESPVDVTALVGRDPCSQGEGSEFVVTGRGGLPPNPGDVLHDEPDVLDWTTREGEESNAEIDTNVPQSANPHIRSQLIEATGWVIDKNGMVVLVADAPKVAPSSPAFIQPGCHR
jgi:filamentous hemagglutinin family protein